MTSSGPAEPSPAFLRRVENVWVGWGGGGGPSQGFQIDIEAAERLQQELQAAAISVSKVQISLNPAHLTAPAFDQVSINMNYQAGMMAANAKAYLLVWRQLLADAGGALLGQIDEYRRAESVAAGEAVL